MIKAIGALLGKLQQKETTLKCAFIIVEACHVHDRIFACVAIDAPVSHITILSGGDGILEAGVTFDGWNSTYVS